MLFARHVVRIGHGGGGRRDLTKIYTQPQRLANQEGVSPAMGWEPRNPIENRFQQCGDDQSFSGSAVIDATSKIRCL